MQVVRELLGGVHWRSAFDGSVAYAVLVNQLDVLERMTRRCSNNAYRRSVPLVKSVRAITGPFWSDHGWSPVCGGQLRTGYAARFRQ